MHRLIPFHVVLLAALAGSTALAQSGALDRLPSEALDAAPPSERVSGPPGQMKIAQTACRAFPIEQVRRRIVDVAVQEWAYFGFSISDQTVQRGRFSRQAGVSEFDPRQAPRGRRRFGGLGAEEAARVADSIAGYWATTPDGSWILDRQNEVWSQSAGVASRWRDPWSAAFVSWVMCEAGLADGSQFRRAIAHHTYIDQAIRARDANSASAAFAAYDTGETRIVPGDLLCSARRPGYSSIAERRQQMGEGARTHCDVVVKVDEARSRILTIGGNVRGTVSLKLLPALGEGAALEPGSGIFAHLKLRTDPIEPNALDHSPTIQAVGCTEGFAPPSQLLAASVAPLGTAGTLC